MKTPRVTKFRCYCVECSDDDKPEGSAPKTKEAPLKQEDNGEKGSDLRLAADSIERLLFGT